MARRLIHTVKGPRTVKVYWDPEWREYIARIPGRPEADSFTPDKDDALNTAKAMSLEGVMARRKLKLRYVYDPDTCGRLRIHGPAPRGFVEKKPARCGGLGSVSSEHTDEGQHALDMARISAKAAVERALADECSPAVLALTAGAGWYGHAVAHSKSGGSILGMTLTSQHLDEAKRVVMGACIVKRRRRLDGDPADYWKDEDSMHGRYYSGHSRRRTKRRR